MFAHGTDPRSLSQSIFSESKLHLQKVVLRTFRSLLPAQDMSSTRSHWQAELLHRRSTCSVDVERGRVHLSDLM